MKMENTTDYTFTSTTLNATKNTIPIFQAILTLVLVAIMFGMGCAVDLTELKANLQRPVGLILGLLFQIILMPALTFILAKVFSLTPVQSLALALIGFSPGGSMSNVATYLVKGDISLSVSMTTCSNALAIATIPLWVVIYSAIEHIDDELKVNYITLVVASLSVALPVTGGVYFRYKCPKRARLAPKISAAIAMVVLIITILVMVFFVKIPFVFSINTALAASILPFIGTGIAYLNTSIPGLKLNIAARKAIAIETGIQNKGIPNSVLILNFGRRFDIYSHAVTIPLIYTISQTVLIILIVTGYRLWLCMKTTLDIGEKELSERRVCADQQTESEPLQRSST